MRRVDWCKAYRTYSKDRSLFPHYDPADGLHNDAESCIFYLCCLQGHQHLLHCACEGDHSTINNVFVGRWLRGFPNLVLGCCGFGAGRWCRSVCLPWSDEFGRNPVAGTYMERGMLLAPLLLLFRAFTPSVTAGIVCFELSLPMATSASETSRGRLAVDANVLAVVALRKAL
jgi:hypothetical protein